MNEPNGKRLLVTAGNTASPIDKVRVISNIFRGRTGEAIAMAAACDGWQVTLLSSISPADPSAARHPRVTRIRYRTYDELAMHMEIKITRSCLTHNHYDAVIHSAAVSDYRLAGVFEKDVFGKLTRLQTEGAKAGKIPSSNQELFLRLVPTQKLIDNIREPWGFRGKLVKFKLQVDMSDEQLLDIARRSLAQSKADLIVANCLEWSAERAYIVGADGTVENVKRPDLPAALLRRLA